MSHGSYGSNREHAWNGELNGLAIKRRLQLERKRQANAEANALRSDWRELRSARLAQKMESTHVIDAADMAEAQLSAMNLHEKALKAVALSEARFAEQERERQAKEEWLEEQTRLTESLTARYSSSDSEREELCVVDYEEEEEEGKEESHEMALLRVSSALDSTRTRAGPPTDV